MKKIYLFCTKWWLFLTELPPALLLTICIYYNNMVENPGKLYPLMVFCIAAMILIFLYFFRLISISTEEISSIGLFSSRDSAVIEKDTSLVITMLKGEKIRIELDGRSKAPGFSWIKGGEYEETDINLYRDRAVGGDVTVRRILSFFSVTREDTDRLISGESFSKEYDFFTVSGSIENERKRIKIRFNETI